jgi:hypothetical protein
MLGMPNKGTRRVQFINGNKSKNIPVLKTNAYAMGFNVKNPFSKGEGWQTNSELSVAAKREQKRKELLSSLLTYKPPYAYQDPSFIYPIESRKNVANAATQNVANYLTKMGISRNRRTRRTRRRI